MGHSVTLGGERLGAEKKMKVYLHGYERSSHDLSRGWRSTMGWGTLVPFLCEVTTNGATWDIDTDVLIRTHPTNGPVFGKGKFQADYFSTPIRLYNRALHNNKLGIGMKMQTVVFPQVKVVGSNPDLTQEDLNSQQINGSALICYLGIRGLGKVVDEQNVEIISVWTNAMYILTYWDIYKNYYANKQEEIGMYVDNTYTQNPISISNLALIDTDKNFISYQSNINSFTLTKGQSLRINGVNIGKIEDNVLYAATGGTYEPITGGGVLWDKVEYEENYVYLIGLQNTTLTFNGTSTSSPNLKPNLTTIGEGELSLKQFDLKNIDDMREDILGAPTTAPFRIDENSKEPYNIFSQVIEEEENVRRGKNYYPLAGLGIKTYMSDRFNNWLNTEWIDGVDGVNAISAMNVVDGQITIDEMNIKTKVYEMLNRIAVSDGTYNAWQEANYGEKTLRMAETPMYMGGMAADIHFNEVVSTAASGSEPLGTLGGRGNVGNVRGGTVRIKAEEPTIIMGICSITPRIDYYQGNKWWTRLENMDDLHKPALDQIGFQELITDEMAAFDTNTASDGEKTYKSAGKQTAYIEWQTSQSEVYGNFADINKEMFMVLTRRYEHDEEGNIKDLTTYVDPTKYLYPFASVTIDNQPFWVQIGMDITARLKMSAKQIPNI